MKALKVRQQTDLTDEKTFVERLGQLDTMGFKLREACFELFPSASDIDDGSRAGLTGQLEPCPVGQSEDTPAFVQPTNQVFNPSNFNHGSIDLSLTSSTQ